MQLHRLTSFRRETGHCWIADLPQVLAPGDSADEARRSSLRVFEGAHELGPPSSSHDHIRNSGRGAFSHWHRQLYLSATDNSDPNANGRTYMVVAPVAGETAHTIQQLERIADSPGQFQHVLRRSLSQQGSALHAVYALRTLRGALAECGVDVAGKRILEIGASPAHGLAVALALLGASRITVNNIVTMTREVSAAQATNVAALTNLMGATRRRLSEVVHPVADGDRVGLNGDLFEMASSTDAAALDLADESIDIEFSFSVLEHIRHLPAVLQRLRRAIAPGGIAAHWIDLRDHTDFGDPLKYLRLSDEEFAATYGPEHNRWRRSDYVRMFEENGWRVLRQRVAGQLPTIDGHTTDLLAVVTEGTPYLPADRMLDLPAIDRRRLAVPYAEYPGQELAVMAVEILAVPAASTTRGERVFTERP